MNRTENLRLCLLNIVLTLFSCFNNGFVGPIVSVGCIDVFSDAIVSTMVCVFTMEHHSRWLYRLVAICISIDGIFMPFMISLNN